MSIRDQQFIASVAVQIAEGWCGDITEPKILEFLRAPVSGATAETDSRLEMFDWQSLVPIIYDQMRRG